MSYIPHSTTRRGGSRAPRWLAFHEAGHAVARLALDAVAPIPGPHISRVVVRGRDEWDATYINQRGCECEDLLGVVETDDRCTRAFDIDREEALALPPGVREMIRLDAIEDLAGPVAETCARRWSSIRGWLSLYEGNDFWKARHRLGLLGREDELEATWRESWRLVRVYWPAVTAVAEALLRQHELTGEEVEAEAAAAMPEGPWRWPAIWPEATLP